MQPRRNHLFKLNPDHFLLLIIFLLGLSHALLYALIYPPWGLIDETQHFHYIQVIAEEQRLPIMWQDMLSEEIIDSVMASERYVITLGAPVMPSRDEITASERLDSYSYQAYHPPLYYTTLAPLYSLLSSNVLSKLFTLRIIGVIFSSLTLLVIWQSCRWLWPKHSWIAVIATLVVALNPERATSVARLNNDIFLEILSAISFGLLAFAIVKGASWRIAFALGLSLGLASLSKISAFIITPALLLGWGLIAFHQKSSWRVVVGQLSLILGIALTLVIPFLIRNYSLYNDPTGTQAFINQVGSLTEGSLSELLFIGVVDLFRNSWATLWDNAQVVSKPSAAFIHLALFIEITFVMVVIVRAWQTKHKQIASSAKIVIVVSTLTILLISASALAGYARGFLPVIQGRFLLPALIPAAWLIGFGLWLVGPKWRGFLATFLIFLETILGMSTLFFHTLPEFYAPRDVGFLGYWEQTIYLFTAQKGMFWDKPDFINIWSTGLVLIAFGVCLIIVSLLAIRTYGSPIHLTQLKAILNFLVAQQINPQSHSQQRATSLNWQIYLRNFIKDPLLWLSLILFVGYLGWIGQYPENIFWSLDEGGKFIHLQSILQSNNLNTNIPYPGQYLDTTLNFVPLFYWVKVDNQIFSWWPINLPLITLPFYQLFGWLGLYILPALAGATTAFFSGLLVRRISPDYQWVSWGAVLIVGLATPVTFYSTTFWEHTLNVVLILIGVFAIMNAWHTNRSQWIVLAGILLALATYLRTDTLATSFGVGVAMLVIYWRWAIFFGISYVLTSLLWLTSNWLIMGHFLARYWAPGDVSLNVSSTRLFLGFYDTGLWFIPYTLFNAPRIAAFSLGSDVLTIGLLLTILAIILPFISSFKYYLLFVYGGIILICSWVLFQTEGYRSVHGFLLIAPHIIFAVWLYRNQTNWRVSLFSTLLLNASTMYAIAYFTRGWVAAGGLQWGPRYMLVFYPLLVIASLVGLTKLWSVSPPILFKFGIVILYGISLLVGFGYQVRGVQAALETRQYYQQTQEAIQNLETETVVTNCDWLPMVISDLYWTGSIFDLSQDQNSEQTFEHWVNYARQAGIRSVCQVEMDLCELTPLHQIRANRLENSSGIETQCFVE